jgi:hypothetical protein
MLNWLHVVTIPCLALAVALVLAMGLRTGRVRRFVHVGHLPLPSHRTVEEISTCAQMALLSIVALALMAAFAVAIAIAVR